MHTTDPLPDPPERIEGLRRLAYNLWWSGHRRAWQLFQMLDPHVWRDSDHNPIRMLDALPGDLLEEAAGRQDFLAHYDAVMDEFQRAESAEGGWFPERYGSVRSPVAYFSAEYGLHSSLRVYAGGLGVLGGDYLKECGDLAVPIVAVGMIYRQGYVHQHIRQDGWQEELEEPVDRAYNPISRVLDDDGEPLTVPVPALEPPVHVGVWEVKVGRVSLYLLDPDLEINRPWDRNIASRLYVSDAEHRLRQQVLLGLGGMRVLESLGVEPAALHLNEGHLFLAVLERIRSRVAEGATFGDALDDVRATTIFTTHTPVPAGTDVFPFQLVEKVLGSYLSQLGADRDTFFALGTDPAHPEAGFNTTVFALRTAGFRNGVSRRHGEVAREMWGHLWPDRDGEDVPIQAITNGVHLPSWIEAGHVQPLLDEHLGPSWLADQDRPDIWDGVDQIPDDALWRAHQDLKAALLAEIDARARANWHEERSPALNVVAFGALLDPQVLTLGFARRFTGYKRPDLILHDIDRFRRLVTDPVRPVQIVFAGEAHPDDVHGKRLIQKVFQVAQNPEFAGRIAFVEDYDKELAAYMVHGVDVWLNNPVPPQEASGTSGMKASVNGVPNLSVLDGWWLEGYDGENGWAFGEEELEAHEDRNARDAEAIYRLLEEEIVPRYYGRGEDGVPHAFVQVMKRAIKTVAPHFGTRRMVKEYVERFYPLAP
ncbi:MAG: alpha-glucan family phosphorylase [Chloroflexota bacterium]|nr:alpha-glucan family phosphorylase [Chloroflexota bacterium]